LKQNEKKKISSRKHSDMDTKEFNDQQKVMMEQKSKKEVQSNGNYRI